MSTDHQEEHSPLIKTPRQLAITIVLAFIVPVLLLVFLASEAGKWAGNGDVKTPMVKQASNTSSAAAPAPAATPAATAPAPAMAAPTAAATPAPATPAAPATAAPAAATPAPETAATPAPAAASATPAPSAADTAAPSAQAVVNPAGEKLYQTSCFACHGTGAAGAPKLGDKAAWAPRIATGMDEMMKVAINGRGAMPPKGGAMSASDDDFKAAVEYLVNGSK